MKHMETQRDHQPNAGRIAVICEKCPEPKPRRFLNPDALLPECEKHGRMTVQENRPYRGMKIPAVA